MLWHFQQQQKRQKKSQSAWFTYFKWKHRGIDRESITYRCREIFAKFAASFDGCKTLPFSVSKEPKGIVPQLMFSTRVHWPLLQTRYFLSKFFCSVENVNLKKLKIFEQNASWGGVISDWIQWRAVEVGMSSAVQAVLSGGETIANPWPLGVVWEDRGRGSGESR